MSLRILNGAVPVTADHLAHLMSEQNQQVVGIIRDEIRQSPLRSAVSAGDASSLVAASPMEMESNGDVVLLNAEGYRYWNWSTGGPDGNGLLGMPLPMDD